MAGANLGSKILSLARKAEARMGGIAIGSKMLLVISGKDAIMTGVAIGSKIGLIANIDQYYLGVSVNTGCNLHCPPCYLGEKGKNRTMDLDIARQVAALPCAGLVAVATEPLYDEASVEVVALMASIAPRMRMITNGVNLEQFAHLITALEAVDISLDGGPQFYDRSPDFGRIVAGARQWKEVSGGKDVYALHTLTSRNCRAENIADMLAGSEAIGASMSFFSPFIPTLGGGDRSFLVGIDEIVERLLPFQGQSDWVLVGDIIHVLAEWMWCDANKVKERKWSEFKSIMEQLHPEHRLIVDADPGDYVVRVDVDGVIRHPLVAAHPGLDVPGRRLFYK